jgi:outer membrane protein assembly factor BamD (BamD/ComL family)
MRQPFLMLVIIAVTAIYSHAPAAKTVVLNEADQWQPTAALPPDLEQISQQIDKGRTKNACKKLEKWLKTNPQSPDRDQALFLQGRALFQRKLYYQAFTSFDKLVTDFPDSALYTPSLYQYVEIARLFLTGAKRKVWGFIPASARTEAIEILDRVIDHWPGSELAATSLMMQADYYYSKRKYLEAQQTYQMVVQNYIGSSYFEKALLRNAESTYAQFNGPKYDGSCLIDARIRYQQFQAHFPKKARELDIATLDQKIINQMSEKEFVTADFYRRTGKIPAARYYWTYIVEHWPETPQARDSRAWLQETQQSVQ